MPDYSIYYGDGSVVTVSNRNQWRAAPSTDVQAVTEWTPPPVTERKWAAELAPGVWKSVEDRRVWTGDSTYNPAGWGQKTGTTIDPVLYKQIANDRAMLGPRP